MLPNYKKRSCIVGNWLEIFSIKNPRKEQKAKDFLTEFYIVRQDILSSMSLSNRFFSSVLPRTSKISEISSVLAICGTMTMLLGGIWDSASHELRIPDTFWTMQHITIYSGASLVACSALLAALVLKHCESMTLQRGMLMILVGAALQLVGGYADYNFHEIYGIDGLVTPSHLTVESGLLVSSAGGFFTIARTPNKLLLRLAPVSIMCILLSASWIGFNMALLVGSVALCVPVFQLFYSGCAVM